MKPVLDHLGKPLTSKKICEASREYAGLEQYSPLGGHRA